MSTKANKTTERFIKSIINHQHDLTEWYLDSGAITDLAIKCSLSANRPAVFLDAAQVACCYNNSFALRLIIKCNYPLNLNYEEGGSLLLMSCWQQSADCVLLLLDAGHDPNHVTTSTESPLIAAVQQREPDLRIVDALINAGADLSVRGWRGESLAHMCASYNRTSSCLELLHSRGASLQETARDGKTPLDWADAFAISTETHKYLHRMHYRPYLDSDHVRAPATPTEVVPEI